MTYHELSSITPIHGLRFHVETFTLHPSVKLEMWGCVEPGKFRSLMNHSIWP